MSAKAPAGRVKVKGELARNSWLSKGMATVGSSLTGFTVTVTVAESVLPRLPKMV